MDAVYLLPCKPGSVYVNLGSECLNDCRFCVSRFGDFFGQELEDRYVDIDLEVDAGLERISAVGRRIDHKPREVVICGTGEPFLYYDAVIHACRKSQELFGDATRVRADTAGLWWERSRGLGFLDYIDRLSVSLNAESEEKYNAICQPKAPDAYPRLMGFLHALAEERDNRGAVGSRMPQTRLTVVDTSDREFMPPRKPADASGECPVPDLDKCQAIADSLGFKLVVKKLFRDSMDDCWDMKSDEETLLSGKYLEKCIGCRNKHI